jgi:hypothetical protein
MDLGAGQDLTDLVALRPAMVFILFLGLCLDMRFGFISELGLSLSTILSLALGMKGLVIDKKN